MPATALLATLLNATLMPSNAWPRCHRAPAGLAAASCACKCELTPRRSCRSAGVVAGVEADDLVAQQLGAASASQMTDVQEQYKDAIKRKLEEVGRAVGGRALPVKSPLQRRSPGCSLATKAGLAS